jgi:hypothetical protein
VYEYTKFAEVQQIAQGNSLYFFSVIFSQSDHHGAFFCPWAGKKTGLFAPTPRICPCKSCGVSAAIPCAPKVFPIVEQALKRF